MTAAVHSESEPARRTRRLFAKRPTATIVTGLTFLSAVLLVLTYVTNAGASPEGLLRSLVVISIVPIVVSFAQALVVLTGGLDLSIPWVMTMGGVFLTGIYAGTGSALLATVAVIVAGFVVGTFNGIGVTFFRVPAVVMTLGMNVIVQGVVLLQTNGAPRGTAPEFLVRVMNGADVAGIPNSLWLLILIVILGTLVFTRTSFGRRVYAVGGSLPAAKIAGLPTRRTIILVYGASGAAAALAGVLLTGYTERSFLGMGDQYLLPSIAAVVIGGASVLGGRGGYLQTAAGVIFLSAATITLGGQSSEAAKAVIFGAVILVSAILFNRQSSRV